MLSGRAEDFERAFGVELVRYEEFGGSYRGYLGDLRLPRNLRPLIVAIFGLDNRPLLPPVGPTVRRVEVAEPRQTPHPRTARDALRLPATPTGVGKTKAKVRGGKTVRNSRTGQRRRSRAASISILRLEEGFDQERRSASYFQALGLPTPAPITCGTSTDVHTAIVETHLDIEVIGTLARARRS